MGFARRYRDIKGGLTKGKRRRAPKNYCNPIPSCCERLARLSRPIEIKMIEATVKEIADLELELRDILFDEGGDHDKLAEVRYGRTDPDLHSPGPCVPSPIMSSNINTILFRSSETPSANVIPGTGRTERRSCVHQPDQIEEPASSSHTCESDEF